MQPIKLLFICLSAVYAANASAQVIIVPKQKIEWNDVEQNRTNFSVVGDLCSALVNSDHSVLPFFAFRASSSANEKFNQPFLSNISTLEISSSYFDKDQLQSIGDEFRVEVESVQSSIDSRYAKHFGGSA